MPILGPDVGENLDLESEKKMQISEFGRRVVPPAFWRHSASTICGVRNYLLKILNSQFTFN